MAKVAEFEGCVAHGVSEAQALEILKEVMRAWIEIRLDSGLPVPEPEEEDRLPSGKWIQRVPRSLHKKLIEAAKRDGVSMNQYCTSLLAEGIGLKQIPAIVSRELVLQLKSIVMAEQHRRSAVDIYKYSATVSRWNCSSEGAVETSRMPSTIARTVQMMKANYDEIQYEKPHSAHKEVGRCQ